MLQAIDTVYNGYRFRSRLEARWAVFFDALKIEYIYEPEGYILHDDSKYLPDFFLNDVRGGMWIEVKHANGSGAIETKKLEMLCTLTNHTGMIVSGDPMVNVKIGNHESIQDVDNGTAWWIICNQDNDDYYACDGPYCFCLCPWCGKVGVEFDGRGARVCGYRAHFDDEESAIAAIRHMGHWHSDKAYTGCHPIIVKAAEKARQARFEHGENVA